MKSDKQINQQETASQFLASKQFYLRLKVYFYLSALIVSGQLIWMIDHSLSVYDKGCMETINSKTVSELGFSAEQIEKMDANQNTANRFSSLFSSLPDA